MSMTTDINKSQSQDWYLKKLIDKSFHASFHKFETQIKFMTEIVIDKKKYVLVPEKDYKALQKKAALKTKPEKLLNVEDARAYSKKLIRKWAAEK